MSEVPVARRKEQGEEQKHREPFDPAALAGAAVAAAIAVTISPGPYDVLSVVIGATLLAIIGAYEQGRRRNLSQSAAMGTVIGLVAILPAGYLLELLFPRFTSAPRSLSWSLAGVWLVIALVVVRYDRSRQGRRGV